jgi:hypothetical protein
MARSEQSQETAQAKSIDSNFPGATELPDLEAQVLLAFHGLMSLTYSDLGFCEVAINNKAPEHKFRIAVYDDLSSSAKPFYTYNFGSASTSPFDVIRFDVVNPHPDTLGVRFYQPVNFQAGTPEHGRIVEDPMDFRLLNDLEGEEFYNRALDKKREAFRPRIHIKNGTFVTLVATPANRTFKREAPNDSLILGTAIYLDRSGYVSLRIGPEELKLEPKNGSPYLIVFDNSCLKEVCNFDPGSAIKEKRNDFFEYYKMFSIPEDKEEYQLLLEHSPLVADPDAEGSNQVTAVPSSFVAVMAFLRGLVEKQSSTDAPCGPVAYGGGQS